MFGYKILNLLQLFVLDLDISDSVKKLFIVEICTSPKIELSCKTSD